MPASPTPGSPQMEVRQVTQEALWSLGDLGSARLHRGPLARRLPLPSSPGPQESQPSSDEQKSPRPWLHSRQQVQHALPLGSPYLGPAQHFPDSVHSPAARTRCTRPPGADHHSSGPGALPPAHPSSHAALFCALSLARCPLPALELLVLGTAMRLLQAPGWPPGLRTFGRP